MPQIGKNIELYLMDGEASGRWQATLSNWNCCSYKIPRGDLKRCDDLPEIYSPGVYFLFGRDDESGRQFVYVGEGDNVAKRILQLCEEKGLAVNALANLAGIAPSTIYSMLNEKSQNPGVVSIKKICDGIDISVREFFNCDLFEDLEQEIK